MDRLGAMRAFAQVVKAGSFSAAAREEGTTQSAISKKVAALEDHLGSRLLLRSSRDLKMTDVGAEFYRRSCAILAEVDDAEAVATSASAGPKGVLRVSMSPVLSRLVLAPVLGDFLQAYPEIKMILKLTERHCDLVAEGLDVVIRAKHLEDSTLHARLLSPNPLIVAAAPAYLEAHGEPHHPHELADHNCLVFSRFSDGHSWQFSRRGKQLVVPVDGNMRCDQGDSLIEFAILGAGIIMLPPWLMRNHLKGGRLRQLMPDWQPQPVPIHIVYPKTRHVPQKIRCFAKFVGREVRRRDLLPA